MKFFLLRNVNDLLRKLECDYEKLKRTPLDVDLAFNFFVTAEHLLDWLHPGYTNEKKRRDLRENEILLQITSHLANGAKHFVVEKKHHKSVKKTGIFSSWPLGSLPRRSLPAGSLPGSLTIVLDGDAARQFGAQISVLNLATRVLQFWQNHIKSTT